MDLGTPQEWSQGAGAIKTAFDALRSAWVLIKDVRGSGKGAANEDAVVGEALRQAETAAKIAEAQIAKALGYQLCHCTFPPTAMLTVGYSMRVGPEGRAPQVFECSRCGYNTAGGYVYERLIPPRTSGS
jgi:hypothetical protein